MYDGKLVVYDEVALLAEGVDRNRSSSVSSSVMMSSPSSRRAWIEMWLNSAIALLGESPSSRRAWIEIPLPKADCRPDTVALLAEGVDRNAAALVVLLTAAGRPPRGGRG